MDDDAELEAQLEAQLQAQREALAGIDSVASSVEEEEQAVMLSMRNELREAVSELEAALLEIKRARILRHLAAADSASAELLRPIPAAVVSGPTGPATGPPAPDSSIEGAAARRSPALAPPPPPPPPPPSGTLCHFRYMDGRWYSGRLYGPGRQAGTLSVAFEVPTRPFMLEPVDIMEALVRPAGLSAQPATATAGITGGSASATQIPSGPAGSDGAGNASGLEVGRRALARLPGSRLFVPVEVTALDRRRGTVSVMPLLPQGAGPGGSGGGGEVVVPLALVTRHAHVPAADVARGSAPPGGGAAAGAGGGTSGDGDPGGGAEVSDGEGSDDSDSVSVLLRPGIGGVGSDMDSDSSMGDGDDYGGRGGDEVDGSDGDDGGDSDDGDDGDGDDGDGGDGLDVFGHARLAAAAGALGDTALLAEWESHSRGVASRLLVRMGYVRGRGLGSLGQGSTDAPEVLLLPERRGLGAVDRDRVRRIGGSSTDPRVRADGGVSKRRKRGGAKQKRKRAITAAREARREAQEQEEGAPGGGGLFDFINSSLGDSSVAARVRKAQVALAGTAGPEGSRGAAAATAGAAAIAGAVAAASGGPPRAAPDRQGLMSHHDNVAGIQTKLARLREMLGRHKDNRGLRTQIEAQIRAVQAELSEAQSAAARVSKAISDKDAQKKWLKF